MTIQINKVYRVFLHNNVYISELEILIFGISNVKLKMKDSIYQSIERNHDNLLIKIFG
jgi:hypothetical protein